MARDARSVRLLTGAALALATALTRIPFRAHTLFEFDSINFAVATFRFDLGEVTPQMPGYILHVLLGRFCSWITGDVNAGYVWLSTLLSIGSVLFLWRAAAELRGERVALVAALLWLTTPLFWFHGEVAAIYIQEAFWSASLLYLGLRVLHHARSEIVLLVAFSLAGAARQPDLLFFLPAIVYVLWKSRISAKRLTVGLIWFLLTTLVWVAELVRESGGLATYLHYAREEGIFKSQSVLFGNSWSSQFDTIAKVAFNIPLALGACGFVLVVIVVVYPTRMVKCLRDWSRIPSARFVVLMATPAFLFYTIVFFMKAGYLLNVVPSVVLIAAVALDQAAIWIARRTKEKPGNALRLTRPIITRTAIVLTSIAVVINVLWFVAPWPGTSQELYNNENTRNSFVHGAINRFDRSESRYLTLTNRLFEYTNASGVRAVDSINDATYQALASNGAMDSSTVLLASWWGRWAYFSFPHATTFDVEVDYNHSGPIGVGRSRGLQRVNLYDSVIHLPASTRTVLLLMRHDRPDFEDIARQVHLEGLKTPEYLDMYRVLDTSFRLAWGGRIFEQP